MTGTQLIASVHPHLLTWKTRLLVGRKKDSQMINAYLSGQKQHTSSLCGTPHVFSVHAAPLPGLDVTNQAGGPSVLTSTQRDNEVPRDY